MLEARGPEPADVLLVSNPVFGLDFTAVAEVHARLAAARDAMEKATVTINTIDRNLFERYGDVQALMRPILRHRILLNFQAESDKLKADDLLQKIIDSMPVPKE